MARRRTSSSSSRSSLSSNVRLIVSVINTIMRVFTFFRGRSRGATRAAPRTGKSAPPAEKSLPKSPPRPKVARNSPGAATSSSRSRSAPPPPVEPVEAPKAVGSDGGIPDLFRKQQSDVVVTASGRIVKILRDDLHDADGSGQHQQFLVELLDRNRTTVKIAHNLKFGRVPAREGQIITFRGEYEYNDLGGCVHWTHHDPKQWHEDGWIEIDGKRYG